MVNFNNLTSPYLIAEVGINHNGDMQIAKKLIDATFACSWDCVKFQKRNPDLCVPEKQKTVMKKTPWGDMTYLEYRHRMEFSKAEYDIIQNYCKQKPLDWSLSIWDIDSLEFSQGYDIPFIKIPSALLTNYSLLETASQTGMPIILSTGMSSLEEIDTAVDVLKNNATQFVLMHCNSSYPASYDELNLNVITTLKNRYNCSIGYSGHEYGLEPTTIAVSMGATVIERHITLDHTMWGTDQSGSVEIQGMDKLYKQVNNVHRVMGDGKKMVFQSEEQIRTKLRI